MPRLVRAKVSHTHKGVFSFDFFTGPASMHKEREHQEHHRCHAQDDSNRNCPPITHAGIILEMPGFYIEKM
jgi:hypothetical protein